jgi:F-type H+-transporting ATPase subunit delta
MKQNGEQPTEHTADVSAQRIARVYAEALVNAADKQGQGDAVLEDLESLVRDVFRTDPLLETFLASGVISRRRKGEVIRSVFENRASPLLVNLLLVLNEHDRLGLLRTILAEARELRDQRAGRMRIEVKSAVALGDDQLDRLRGQLRQTLQIEPVLETQVDPGLLGGLVVRVGDWVYDSSVRMRLDTIRNQLIERSSHEIQSRRDRFSSAVGD